MVRVVVRWGGSGVGRFWLGSADVRPKVSVRCGGFGRLRMVSFLGRDDSVRLDQELMSERYGFALESLMELAGQTLAHVVVHRYGLERLKQGNGPVCLVGGRFFPHWLLLY